MLKFQIGPSVEMQINYLIHKDQLSNNFPDGRSFHPHCSAMLISDNDLYCKIIIGVKL